MFTSITAFLPPRLCITPQSGRYIILALGMFNLQSFQSSFPPLLIQPSGPRPRRTILHDHEARRLGSCREVYDTRNPCHRMSFSSCVYLFIPPSGPCAKVLSIVIRNLYLGYSLASDPPHPLTTDVVINFVYSEWVVNSPCHNGRKCDDSQDHLSHTRLHEVYRGPFVIIAER